MKLVLKDGITEVWSGNELIGYSDETDDLYWIEPKTGYRVKVCEIDHSSEIIPALENWIKSQSVD